MTIMRVAGLLQTARSREVNMRRLLIAVFLLAPVASACDRSAPVAVSCLVMYQTLFVTARDSVSGALVPNAVLTATGPRTYSASVGSDVSVYPVVVAFVEGTFFVTVQAAGYNTWSKSVTVPSSDLSDCRPPNSVSVTALLQPTP
jgi:hypothetical protein